MTSWITLYPGWYIEERGRLERRYPSFRVSEPALDDGILAYVGELVIDTSKTKERFPVVLVYHAETPYRFPSLTPVLTIPPGVEWLLKDVLVDTNIRWMSSGWRRHQMSDGALCLIEGDARLDADELSGEAVIKRARQVFKAQVLGEPYPFPDSHEAELEEHLQRADDILLGDAFYDGTLTGGGTFYAIPTLDDFRNFPTFVEQADDATRRLFIGIHVTAHGSSSQLLTTEWRTERSEALRSAFPFIGHRKLQFESQLVEGDALSSHSIAGPWFDLNSEPEPIRTVSDLESLLANNGVTNPLDQILAFAGNMREPAVTYVALRYPGRGGLVDWLVLGLRMRECITKDMEREEGPNVRRSLLRDAAVFAVRRHSFRRDDLERRNGEIASRYAASTVLVLGTGALGGDVAETLAKAGVGSLILVDFDRMRPGNSIRHVAGLWATGLTKPDAVRHVIRQHNPYVRVESLPSTATSPLSRLEELMRRTDVAVSTIADEQIEHVVNEAAVRLERTIVFGRALRGGTAARVIRVKPGRDACKACYGFYRYSTNTNDQALQGGPNDEVSDAPVIVPEREGEIISRECGDPILAGSAVDLRFAADLTSRAVLEELDSMLVTGDQNREKWNSLVWVREPLPPPAHSELGRPFGSLLQFISPHPNCSVCSRPRIRQVILSETAINDLKRYAESKADRETGGALIGFEGKDGEAVILEVTDAGPSATETPNRFCYDPDHVNSRLRDAYARLGPRGTYVGEWHTHLESEPRPSARDIASLTAIAAEPQYLTNEPVMLVAGVDVSTKKVAKIHTTCWPNGRAMREISYVVRADEEIEELVGRESVP